MKKFKISMLALTVMLVVFVAACGNSGNNTNAKKGTETPATVAPKEEPVKKNDFPNKEITIIVSNKAAGSNDLAARSIVPYLQEALGVPIVIKNEGGGGGNTARAQIFKEQPDGYTLLETPMPSMAIGEIIADGKFKTLELEPVFNLYGYESNVIIVPMESPIKDLNDLIEASKTKKLKASGSGTATNAVLGSIFLKNIGVEHTYISFGGGTEAAQQVAGGHVDFGTSSEIAAQGLQGDKIRIIASTGHERSEAFPDAPTLFELGYEDEAFEIIYGFWAPPGTPKEIIDILAAGFKKASENSKLAEDGEKIGFHLKTMMPEEFREAIKESYDTILKMSESFDLTK